MMVHERNRPLKDWEADGDDLSQNEIRGREQAVHDLTLKTSSAEQRQRVQGEEGEEGEEGDLDESAVPSAQAHIRTREDVVREKNLGHKSGNMSASTRRQYLTALEAFKVSWCCNILVCCRRRPVACSKI